MDNNTTNNQTQTQELTRANRVAVQAVDGGFEAKFYRTHKQVGMVRSADTQWTPPVAGLNSTAQRELFRVWVCQNAGQFGILYDPADRRTEANQMPAKYTSDQLLMGTAEALVRPDVDGWVAKIKATLPEGATFGVSDIKAEVPVPVTTRNGKETKPKYGNGNWAYATVDVTATVIHGAGDDSVEGYVTMQCQLVSGQLKKPAKIGELGYTYTGFRTDLESDIPALKPQPKAEESKPETPAPTDQPAEGATEQQTEPPVVEDDAKPESTPTEELAPNRARRQRKDESAK